MKKLVIIPAFNEEENIIGTVNDINRNAAGFDYVIVNDCSTDNTKAICEKESFNVINLPVNLGIGGAVQTGYLYALAEEYDYAVQFDGDGQHDARFLNDMYQEICKTDADMVIGSRFIEKEGFQSTGLRRFGIKYFTILIKMLTGTSITDPTSGMRMINKSLFQQFAFDYPKDYPEPESIVAILCNKRRVIEMPVMMKERSGGVSSISPKKSLYYMLKVSLAIIIARLRK